MSVLSPNGTSVYLRPAVRAARLLVWLVPLVFFSALFAFVLTGHPPPALKLDIAAGVVLLGVVTLAITRYDGAVFLGFLLFSVVIVEPAPPDFIFAIVIAVAFATGRLHLHRVPLSAGLLVGGFLVLNLLSAAFVVDTHVAEKYFMITLYLAVFSIWLCGYLDSVGRARGLVRGLLVMAVATSVAGSLAVFVPAIPFSNRISGAHRAQGLFHDPNIFGPFLVVAALLVLEELLQPRLLRSRRPVKFAMLIALGCGVLFAYSRAGWLNAVIGVFVMLLVFALRRGGGKKVFAILIVTLTSVMALAMFVSVTHSAGFLGSRAKLQSYDASRFNAQETGIRLVAAYPFGVGPGQFESYVPVSAHSTYIRSLAEQGVLGLATILGLFLVTLVFATMNAVLGRDTYGIGSAALLGAWCGLIANSAFVDTLHWRHLWLVAALIWAGTMQAHLRLPAEEEAY